MNILLVIFGIIILVIILTQPYMGIVFTAAGLPVVDALPSIGILSSVLPLMGLVTLVGFIFSRKRTKLFSNFSSVQMLGILFVVWIFVSNPQTSVFGAQRNWIFTFIQLLVLTVLTGELFDTKEKHRAFIWAFSLLALISAIAGIIQRDFGQVTDLSIRVTGLAEGSNSAARYFVLGMIFFNYLRTVTNNLFLRLVTILGIIITLIGVFFTVSRTGILLIFLAFALIFVFRLESEKRFRVVVIVVLGFIGLWFLAEEILDVLSTIIPSIVGGTDTIGLRYALWKAGFRMWVDHPIRGVGIGGYISELRNYGQDLMAPRYWIGAVAHNTYVQILAETGVVGVTLFVMMIIHAFKNFKIENGVDDEVRQLRNLWVIVFIVLLVGGLTKSDQADKMFWIILGMSASIKALVESSHLENP